MDSFFSERVMVGHDQKNLFVADDFVVNIRAFDRKIKKSEIGLSVQNHALELIGV